MLFRFSRVQRTLAGIATVGSLGLGLLSCSSYNSRSGGSHPSGLAFRAFVSNPVHPASFGHGPALEIMDATKDLLSGFAVNLSSLGGSVTDAGMMAVSPKKDRTVVVSPSDSRLAIVSNSSESISHTVTLPGPTQSVFVWTDNATAFAAVSTAPVAGSPQGAVLRIDISGGSITATVPIPAVRYIVPSPNGSQILAFSDNLNQVTVITPSLIGAGSQSTTSQCSSTQAAVCTVTASGLDQPIGAVFSTSGTTAYVISCGPECGGAAAGISVLDMGSGSTPPSFTGQQVLVPGGATIGLLQGTTLYVAGTPLAPGNDCSTVTPPITSTSCGRLTLINVTTMAASATVDIADGTHGVMQMGANAQLFVGSVNCTTATCLNPVDTSSGSVSSSNVVWPSEGGNVTGIAPIPNRTVVYVCEGGRLRIYDTSTDKLITTPLQPDIIGQAVDVKVVDF